MNLVETTKEFNNKVDEVMNEGIAYIMKTVGVESFMDDLDDSTMQMMKKYFEILNLSKRIIVEQAEALESMNEKLDKLLERK